MWRGILLATLALLLSAAAVSASPTLLRVTDQYGRTVSNQVKVAVLGGDARLYNATHWLIDTEASAPVRVELYNVTVWQGILETGKSYVVKASVVEMLVETPDPGLVVEVELAGSGKRWRLVGEREYRLYPLPVGTYIIKAHGAVDVEKTIYFTGGRIKISPEIGYRPALPVLAMASLPAIGYAGYRAAKKRSPRREHRAPAKEDSALAAKPASRRAGRNKKDRTLADILASLPE